ncbi:MULTISPECIES: SufD family Fe-S cluster assembly protein [unclassified Sphingopyxis]|uniref:SufD family Fe-S cluster assembly protein n=1 Tax=unclassified Sphingopyxis TaxID=2614943 RepID=UPI0028652CE2|nr:MULTISPECIES: SufD family Fe-S cluster assembly protein [unclassified Sphingopyxis]MDR6834616.1 Fe-S cluster assembly protein SufD [Sphingopyxis sp. BE122]MDR7226886.1 Fe-S cluster assembly protein SufD [Sphingopyxis sp. BE259]
MTTSALPSRRDEAWRYADIDAVTAAWPLPAPDSIVVPAGGRFARAIVQDVGGVQQIAMSIGKGAVASLHVLNVGGAYGRIELAVTLHEGADFHLGAAQIGGGEQNLEIVTTVTHAEPGATSRQVVRSVLGGTATGTYLGKVAVARNAQQTDSAQDVKAMLLNRSATANAKPELEIYADDVKCAHGCAIGELDAMALYYLQSRGLPPSEAKKLMLQAFVAGVFDGAEDEARLQQLALAKLGELV